MLVFLNNSRVECLSLFRSRPLRLEGSCIQRGDGGQVDVTGSGYNNVITLLPL